MMIVAYGLLYGLVTLVFFLFLCQTAQELPESLAEYEIGPVSREPLDATSDPDVSRTPVLASHN